MNEAEQETIYDEGYDACYYELSDIDNCPYSGPMSTVWMAGWIDAEKEDHDGSL